MMLTNTRGKRMTLRNGSGKTSPIRIPQGLRDILPTEASHRRMIENIIREVFTCWGYGEVIPPTFEYFDYISQGLGEDKKKGLVRLFDKNGELLALRSELTAPIARMTAMRFKSMGFPLRLFYFANVFSEEFPRLGHQRERTQAGVELIGSDSPHADAEVIALVIEALLQVGLKDFKIGIGQIDLISKVLRLTGISESDQKEMKKALVRKDMVAIKKGLKELGSSRAESILEIITLRGDAEVIVRASRYARDEASSSALVRLSDIHKILVRSGYRSHIFLDLGIVRDFDYYSSVVFEGYSPRIGYPFCGGGRYDYLLSMFGVDAPSTGFAIEVERLHDALSREGGEREVKRPKVLVASAQDNFLDIMSVASWLRKKGIAAQHFLGEFSLEEAKTYAQRMDMDFLLIIISLEEEMDLIDLKKDLIQRVAPQQLEKLMGQLESVSREGI